MNINEFLTRLKGAKRTGKGFLALCPAHDDHSQSLSVAEGDDGRILLNCFAGCSPESIVRAMDFDMKDLFPESNSSVIRLNGNGPGAATAPSFSPKEIDAVYPYTDEQGEVLYENVKYKPKAFRLRRPDGNGGYVYNLYGIDRVPYRLPALIEGMQRPYPEIWFTEGEKDADSLRSLGFTATSFKTWSPSLNRHIKGVHAVLIRDHDRAGLKLADDGARIINEVSASIRIVDLFGDEPLADKHGLDVSDWIESRKNEGQNDTEIAEELAQIVETASKWDGAVVSDGVTADVGDNSQTSLLSQSERRQKPVLQEAAFHGVAGDAVKIISPHTEASMAAMLIQLLAAFGVIVGRSAWFRIGRTRHYCKLNVVLVGPSGAGRKGTSWDEVCNLMTRANDDFGRIVVSGLSSGEGLINHVSDPIYKKTAIKEKGRIVDYQKELVEEGASEKRALAVESELSRVLKAAGREGSILSEVLRDIYDKDELRVMTKNRLQATGVHVAFIGHITEFELLRELDDTSRANGFANRILWVFTERERLLPLGGEIPDGELNETVRKLQGAYRFAETAGELTRTPAADARWVEIYELLYGAANGLVDSLTSRATTHVMRIACIFALLDQSRQIDVPHLNAALAVWRYCEDTVRYLFGSKVGDKVADTILDALRDGPLSRTEISAILGRHANAATISAAIARLERIGRITAERITDTGGAPRTIYRLAEREKSE